MLNVKVKYKVRVYVYKESKKMLIRIKQNTMIKQKVRTENILS